MEVIEKNGLGQNGWIPTNRYKLNMEGRDNVYVIGDTTNIPISKTGSTAHFEAEDRARIIAAMIKMGDAGARLRRQGVLLHRGRSRPRHLRDVQLPQSARPQTAAKPMHWFKLAYNKLYWTSVRGLL